MVPEVRMQVSENQEGNSGSRQRNSNVSETLVPQGQGREAYIEDMPMVAEADEESVSVDG
jgi:hypothetical protein